MSHVPSNASEVTPDWIASTFKSSQTNNITSATVMNLRQEGAQENGMLSCIFHADVNFTDANNETKDSKVFVKIMPQNDVHKSIISSSFVDVTEIESYRVLFNDLKRFEMDKTGKSGIADIVPTFHSGGYNRDSDNRAYYLMLEDLSPRFQMMDYNKGLTLEQLVKSLEALAQFHATAFAYQKVCNIDFEAKYDFLSKFFNNFDGDKDLQDFMAMNMDLVEKDLKDGHMDHLLPRLKAVRKDLGAKYKKVLKDGGDCKFLIHGDLWANNVMFNSSNDCKLLDWQFTAMGSIFLDFGTMAFYSMDPKETEANMRVLMDAYFDRFRLVCESLGAGSSLPWTREEFGRKAEEMGLFIAFLWCSTSYELVDKYPALKARAFWVLERSVKVTPKYYE